MRLSKLKATVSAGALLIAVATSAWADGKVETPVYTSYTPQPQSQVFQNSWSERSRTIAINTAWCDCCGGLVSSTQIIQVGRDATYQSTFMVTNRNNKF
jgi:hypothetical protein